MGKLKRSRRSASEPDDIVVGFNIEAVPPEDRASLIEDTRRLRDGLIEIARTLLDAGERFSRWKEKLPHGAYLAWVATTGYSEQSARDARNVYLRFRSTPTVFQDLDLALPETAIVRLASAPELALEAVLDRVSEGETLNLKDVKAIISQHAVRSSQGNRTETSNGEPAQPLLGAAGLCRMAKTAHADLATLTEARLADLLHFIHDAQARLPSGRKLTMQDLQKDMRPRAQWLTEALEQLTQRRAASSVKLLHDTKLDRSEYEPGPWADVAAFLRDISHSSGWERIKAADVPHLLGRGRETLEAVLPRDKHRHFTQFS